MAATKKDPRIFFTQGSCHQFEHILNLYEEAVKLKAESKNKKPEEFLKVDRWYQNELPKKIKSRGADAHLVYDEMIKCMKWKLQRGKFSPRLKDLIQMNTPRLCMNETKKAFRAIMKKDDLAAAVAALCNLKGVGPAMASVVLTAGVPDQCGFMADECMMAIPDIESIDYTTKEFLKYVEQLRKASERLNSQGGTVKWNIHLVEKALWAYVVIKELKTEMLNEVPGLLNSSSLPTENGDSTEHLKEKNGAEHIPEESNDSIDSAMANKENLTSNTNGTSDVEDSRASVISNCEDTNDSIAVSEAPSEPVSEAPSETVSEASEDRPSSTTTPIPEATHLSDDDCQPKQKKIKLDE